MTLIDFNEKFHQHIHEWEHAHLTGSEKEDEIEEKQLAEYENWLNTPQEWLDGATPNAYFAAMEDANALVRLLAEYVMSGLGVPEPLDNRLIKMKETVYPLFLYILEAFNEGEQKAIERLKLHIMGLFSEMEKPQPYALYIQWISNAKEKSDLTEEAADFLSEAGEEQKEAIKQAFLHAGHEYAADCLVDILSNYPGDPYIVEMIIDEFENTATKKAFYANCLGKLGDPEALVSLQEALEDRELNYFDYTAIKYAIEELGGAIDIDRDFTEDEDYAKLTRGE